MPADYAKIRDENIARYGWDTAVLDLLGHLYSERTHFIFELIQNAEDAGATELAFELFGDRLEVRHDGRPFTEADVRGVCGVAQSGKSGDLTKIGQFGIGFKSVYAYTTTPRVHSGAEHFRIDHYVRPSPAEPLENRADPVPDSPETLFVFPFDHDTVPAATAVGEISAALNRIEPATLLFLRNISRLRARGVQITGTVIERRTQPRKPALRPWRAGTSRSPEPRPTRASGPPAPRTGSSGTARWRTSGTPASGSRSRSGPTPRTATPGSSPGTAPRWSCSSRRRRRPSSAS